MLCHCPLYTLIALSIVPSCVSSLQRVLAGSVLSLSADLGRFLGDTLFADTELRLSDEATVSAHSAVLAARWPQFREVSVSMSAGGVGGGSGWGGVSCCEIEMLYSHFCFPPFSLFPFLPPNSFHQRLLSSV